MSVPMEKFKENTSCEQHWPISTDANAIIDENNIGKLHNGDNSRSDRTENNLKSKTFEKQYLIMGSGKTTTTKSGCPHTSKSVTPKTQEKENNANQGEKNGLNLENIAENPTKSNINACDNIKTSEKAQKNVQNGLDINKNNVNVGKNDLNSREVDSKGAVYISVLNDKEKFQIPDLPKKCQWSKNAVDEGVVSPHSQNDWHRTGKIQPDVLHLVGNTPMVKLNSIPQKAGVKCNVYAKLEYFNPGGSVKDRVAKRIIEDYEAQGILKPGMTIIEPTSGNTGVGVALASAIKGYKCIIVMSEKMSNEKIAVINSLGAKLIKTPITADSYSAEGIFGIANKMHKEIPDSIILDQFSNPSNPLAHYDTTAEEIWDQCDGKIDVIVLGAGTGGTVTGIARKFKEKSPKTKVIGVDPLGSVFALPESLNKTDVTFFEVEGLGYDFVPTALDQSVVDVWAKSNDFNSLTMARRLIREEGLLCGTSSGAAVSIAMKWAETLEEGQNLVVLLPDSIRNYLTKFVNDVWMEARGFQEAVNVNQHWWWDTQISELNYKKIERKFLDEPCGSVFRFMKDLKINEVAILKRDGNILGTVTLENLMKNLISNSVSPSEPIEHCTVRIYPRIDAQSHMGLASRILEKDNFVVVTQNEGSGVQKILHPIGVIKTSDLFDFISQKGQF